jgi:hypothetical protein
MVSNAASLTGALLAPVTFGASIALSASGTVGSYISNKHKDIESNYSKKEIRRLCEEAKTLVDDDIKIMSDESIWDKPVVKKAKEYLQMANLGRTLTNQAIGTVNAILSWNTANARDILRNSNPWIDKIVITYAVYNCISDLLGAIRTSIEIDNFEGTTLVVS